jgi:hypothetical protein
MIDLRDKKAIENVTSYVQSLLDIYDTTWSSDSKAKFVDLTVASILDKYGAPRLEEILHSWHWTKGFGDMDAVDIYGKNGVQFKGVHSVPAKYVKSTLYTIANKLLPRVDNSNKFILELSVVLFRNTAPYGMIVSNLQPSSKFFHEEQLYSAVGEWNNGLRKHF